MSSNRAVQIGLGVGIPLPAFLVTLVGCLYNIYWKPKKGVRANEPVEESPANPTAEQITPAEDPTVKGSTHAADTNTPELHA
jgi:hypothetical protein